MILAASALPTSPARGPRLELTLVPKAPAPGTKEAADLALRISQHLTVITHEVRLTLINDGDRPVEVSGPPTGGGAYWSGSGIVGPPVLAPEVLDAAGRPVAFEAEQRGTNCMTAPPRTMDPATPVRPGEKRLLSVYNVWGPDGAGMAMAAANLEMGALGAEGQAHLAKGHYRIKFAFDLRPITREEWIASYVKSPPASAPAISPKEGWEARLAKQANKAADHFAAHWREVPSFWSGHLESNVVELDVP